MLSSKLALVTGAGSGIGRATCQVFARENAKVIAVDKIRETAEAVLLQLKGNSHSAFELDVSQSVNIDKVVKDILKVYENPPTIIVNCAGILKDNFILNMSEDCFDKVINVNLKGTFLMVQTFAKLLVDNKLEGSFVNVGSIVAKHGNIGQSNYCASKAGVEMITKVAAKEFGKYGLRCNAVLPGFIKTPMTDAIPEKIRNYYLNQIPSKRFGHPSEVAEVITFLASDKSSYVNGTSVEVTGGF